jgi:AraC family transcriptional regulator
LSLSSNGRNHSTAKEFQKVGQLRLKLSQPGYDNQIKDCTQPKGRIRFYQWSFAMSHKLPAGEFFGKQSQSLEVMGFRLTESRYASGLKLPEHSHELAKFCFVISGDYLETIGHHTHARHPLTLTFHPPDTTHAEAHNANGHHFLVEVQRGWLDYAREYAAPLDAPVEASNAAPVRIAMQLYHEFCHRDHLSPLSVQGLMLELLAETSRHSLPVATGKPPRWLEKIREELHERFQENLSLAELAESAGVHAVHLTRTFRKFHHCTIGDYLRRLRIEYASRQLSFTDAPLAEVASLAGFADQSHFTRLFKGHTGMSPKAYRDACRPR